jgi:hypothetical protein
LVNNIYQAFCTHKTKFLSPTFLTVEAVFFVDVYICTPLNYQRAMMSL